MIQVWYHAGCWDGFCAAWLCYQVFGDNANYIPVSYGKPHPTYNQGDKIYIVDFSYDYNTLTIIAENCSQLVVLDHHKTCPQDHPCVIFNNDKSGARITYEYLYQNHNLNLATGHWLIDYTEDRDLWKWELPKSREINAWLRSYKLDFETWNYLAMGDSYEDGFKQGEAILRDADRRLEQAIRKPNIINFGDYEVPCVNCTDLVSEITGALAVGYPFAMTYRDDGYIRRFSLRSDQDASGSVDVGELAKQYGGGGHKHAAGFEVKILEGILTP